MARLQANRPPRRQRLHEKGKRGLLNIVFGRTFLVLVLLLVQIYLIVSLFMRWQYSTFTYGGSYILSIVMAFHLINRPMNASTRDTWLILLLVAPVLGTALYLFIEGDIGHRLVRGQLQQVEALTTGLLDRNDALIRRLDGEDPELAGLARYTLDNGGYPVYEHTDAEYYPSGEQYFAAILEALEKARHFIFLEYFIISNGEMWQAVLDILRRKAAAGVEVRVMFDGTSTVFRIPASFPAQMRALGIQCKPFSPIRPLISTHYNNRDHRKILVVDGHTAFTGGINLSDEYINRREMFGHWKDTGVRVQGEAARSFTLMFLQMWCTNEHQKEFAKYLSAPVPDFPDKQGYVLPYGDTPYDDELVGASIYLDILAHADHYVHIMTPYLILGQTMITALTFAAKRGVDVKIILPHIPDKKFAFALAWTHYAELIKAGVKIYEYTPGFVHAKSFVSDDSKAVVGSINLDHRSLNLHFECAALFSKSPVVADVEADFQRTLQQCQRVTREDIGRVPLYRKVLGFILKPVAPLM